MKKLKSFMLLAIAVNIITASCSPSDTDSLVNSEEYATDVERTNPYAMDIDEAQDVLEQILSKTSNNTRSEAKTIKSRFTLGADNRTRSTADDEHPSVHVFNLDDNGGFAIMSADKRTSPVLALTESGEITQEMRTDNLGLIVALEDAEAAYKAQLKKAEETETNNTRSTTVTTQNGIITILDVDSIIYKTMCKAKWTQDDPYNKYCFVPNSNIRAMAGCTAVAVSYLMSCYKYPEDYNQHTFQWDEMISDNFKNQIARLLQQLGLPENLNAQYGIESSPILLSNIPRTLANFGYSHTGDIIAYNLNSVWMDICSGHPVIMDGKESVHKSIHNPFGILISYNADYEGHAWLASGVQSVTTTVSLINATNGELIAHNSITGNSIYYNFGTGSTTTDGFYLVGDADLNDETSTYKDPNGNIHTTVHENNYLFDRYAVIGIEP